MAAIQHLLQRWGFVKLGRFGLELTPEGRILSRRPAVLDDGAGNRVVGWEDSDLAAAELAPWQPEARRALVVPRVIPPASPIRPVPPAASASVRPVEVAAEAAVDEDDWEWTIALARARAAAEPSEPVRQAPRATALRTRPMPTVAAPDPASSSTEWPKTAPTGAIDYEDYSRVATRPAMPVPRPPAVLTTGVATPSTVIPVPALPSMPGARLAPVVRTIAAQAGSARRYAKGTAPIDPDLAAMSEDTTPNLSIGDRTRPGIAMPAAARAVALPSTKRRVSPRG